MSPSAGNISPGFTSTRSPTRTCSIGTSFCPPPGSTSVACFGDALSNALTSRCVRSSANSSIAPEAENRKSKSVASPHAPMAIAPVATASMRKWMSSFALRTFSHVSFAASQPPATIAMI
jgi:hypothetical protein